MWSQWISVNSNIIPVKSRFIDLCFLTFRPTRRYNYTPFPPYCMQEWNEMTAYSEPLVKRSFHRRCPMRNNYGDKFGNIGFQNDDNCKKHTASFQNFAGVLVCFVFVPLFLFPNYTSIGMILAQVICVRNIYQYVVFGIQITVMTYNLILLQADM